MGKFGGIKAGRGFRGGARAHRGPRAQGGGPLAKARQARESGGPKGGCPGGNCGGAGGGEGAGGGGGGGGGIGDAISSIAGAVSSIAGAAGGGGGGEEATQGQQDQIDPSLMALINSIGGVDPMQAGLMGGGANMPNLAGAYGM